MSIINKKYSDLSKYHYNFYNASPFPHIILDDFLNVDYFQRTFSSEAFSKSLASGKLFNNDFEKEKWISLNVNLPSAIACIINDLNANFWIKNLINLTHINSLKCTNLGNTKLANFHEMKSNAFLGPHVDHSHEPDTGLPHVLNIIIYLSHEWDSRNGGATLFHDKNGKEAVTKVEYKPNRAVIFLHTPYSFHSVERTNNNIPTTRKSIYVDYYSKSFDPYKNLPLNFPKKWFKHNTTFIFKNGLDYFKPNNIKYTCTYFKYLLNRIF